MGQRHSGLASCRRRGLADDISLADERRESVGKEGRGGGERAREREREGTVPSYRASKTERERESESNTE